MQTRVFFVLDAAAFIPYLTGWTEKRALWTELEWNEPPYYYQFEFRLKNVKLSVILSKSELVEIKET